MPTGREKAAIALDLAVRPYSTAARRSSFQLRGADSGLTGFAVAYARNGTAVTGPADAGVIRLPSRGPPTGDHQPYSAATTLSITRSRWQRPCSPSPANMPYDGTKRTITPWMTAALKAADYTAEVTGNQDAGTDTIRITVTATESGNYSGTVSKTFSIAPRPYGDGRASPSGTFQTSPTRGGCHPGWRSGTARPCCWSGTDFTYTYQNNIGWGPLQFRSASGQFLRYGQQGVLHSKRRSARTVFR